MWFAVCDRYGALVPHLDGAVDLSLAGAGELIGDTSFNLAETGGVGAVWVRSKPGAQGTIVVSAQHPQFPKRQLTVQARAFA